MVTIDPAFPALTVRAGKAGSIVGGMLVVLGRAFCRGILGSAHCGRCRMQSELRNVFAEGAFQGVWAERRGGRAEILVLG